MSGLAPNVGRTALPVKGSRPDGPGIVLTPDGEAETLVAYRLDCSRALHELAEAMVAQERDARTRRDHSLANAMRHRAEAYRHAAAIVLRFRV